MGLFFIRASNGEGEAALSTSSLITAFSTPPRAAVNCFRDAAMTCSRYDTGGASIGGIVTAEKGADPTPSIISER